MKFYSKTGYRYSISDAHASQKSLTENGFFEMQSEWPGEPYKANADGTWSIDKAVAFDMLRTERNKRIAETDYLMTSDYPITEEGRAAIMAYRQALRNLPAQEGAPWNGDTEVPWPVLSAEFTPAVHEPLPSVDYSWNN